jgi:hypothetical protein
MQKGNSNNRAARSLALLVVLAVWMCMVGVMQAQAPDHQQDPILGTCLITVFSDSAPPFLVYETYASSGAMSAVDNEAPSSQETLVIGNWRKVGAHKYYEEQRQFLYDTGGNFIGTWIGQIEDDLTPSGNLMSPAPFTYEIIDAYGNVIASGSGTSAGFKLPENLMAPHHVSFSID